MADVKAGLTDTQKAAAKKAADSAIAKKKKERKIEAFGYVHVHASFNNTIVTITDRRGNVIVTSSSGAVGFKGSKKSTPFAAQMASERASQRAFDAGVREVDVKVKGPGMGRESAVRAIESAGIKVLAIKDVTPIPHNGCRPKKRRRV
ncbi:MAG: 30S ribosomal protein S11 [Spirochaetes bacterium]|nr:30S ribosomal protein S11 [Spirochaetota bacterium]